MNLPSRRLLAALALLAGLVGAPGSAMAAQSYDNCTGFIDSLPATVATQGVWCLDKNLGTAITSGSAIRVDANNVTIDCNDFKIGGLAAGDASRADGVYASDRQNVTVRHCNVRGFYRGIYLQGGAGHLVEDNRLDNTLYIGIGIGGPSENNRVRRNAIYDTGGVPGRGTSWGINASAHVIGNTVSGVFADHATPSVTGILARGNGNVVRNNHVSGLQSGAGYAYGIRTSGLGRMIEGNHVAVPAGTAGRGLIGDSVDESACRNNVVAGYAIAMNDCLDAGRNVSLSL